MVGSSIADAHAGPGTLRTGRRTPCPVSRFSSLRPRGHLDKLAAKRGTVMQTCRP